MVKTLSSNNSAVLNDSVIKPVYFIKFEFPTGTVYLNSSDRNFTISGQEYLGIGLIGSILPKMLESKIKENPFKYSHVLINN